MLGAVGLGSIARSEGKRTGKGMALAGLLVGIIGIPWTIGILYFGFQASFGRTLESVSPVADKYLTLISEGQYQEAYDMTSPMYQRFHPYADFKQYNEDLRKLHGDFRSKKFKLLGGGIFIKTDNSGTTASVAYNVNYTKHASVVRRMTFRKHGDTWLVDQNVSQ